MTKITNDSKIRVAGYLLFLVVPLLLWVWVSWKVAITYFLVGYGWGCIKMIFDGAKKRGSK